MSYRLQQSLSFLDINLLPNIGYPVSTIAFSLDFWQSQCLFQVCINFCCINIWFINHWGPKLVPIPGKELAGCIVCMSICDLPVKMNSFGERMVLSDIVDLSYCCWRFSWSSMFVVCYDPACGTSYKTSWAHAEIPK